MFVGKGRMYSAAFFDVERIEVIKGTQSTLLGKNTSLGAISVISKITCKNVKYLYRHIIKSFNNMPFLFFETVIFIL
jgi:hypothetical protein